MRNVSNAHMFSGVPTARLVSEEPLPLLVLHRVDVKDEPRHDLLDEMSLLLRKVLHHLQGPDAPVARKLRKRHEPFGSMFWSREVGLGPSKCLKWDILRQCHVNITAGHLGIMSTREESKDLFRVIFKMMLGVAKGVTPCGFYGTDAGTHSENSLISSGVRALGRGSSNRRNRSFPTFSKKSGEIKAAYRTSGQRSRLVTRNGSTGC